MVIIMAVLCFIVSIVMNTYFSIMAAIVVCVAVVARDILISGL
jgi:hypothetical protein